MKICVLQYVTKYCFIKMIIYNLVRNDKQVYPQYKILTKGSNLTVHCDSMGPVRWFALSKIQLKVIHQVDSKDYHLNNAVIENSGKYYCFGTSKSTNFVARALVIVEG